PRADAGGGDGGAGPNDLRGRRDLLREPAPQRDDLGPRLQDVPRAVRNDLRVAVAARSDDLPEMSRAHAEEAHPAARAKDGDGSAHRVPRGAEQALRGVALEIRAFSSDRARHRLARLPDRSRRSPRPLPADRAVRDLSRRQLQHEDGAGAIPEREGPAVSLG